METLRATTRLPHSHVIKHSAHRNCTERYHVTSDQLFHMSYIVWTYVKQWGLWSWQLQHVLHQVKSKEFIVIYEKLLQELVTIWPIGGFKWMIEITYFFFYCASSLPLYQMIGDNPVPVVSRLLWTFVGTDISNMTVPSVQTVLWLQSIPGETKAVN